MKTTYKDYLKLIFFILFLIATVTLYILSTQDKENSRVLMFAAVFTSVFAAMFSSSITDIITNHLYNKAKNNYPQQFINPTRVLEYAGHAAGYIQVSTLLLSTMFFYSTLIDSTALKTFCVLLGVGSVSLLIRKISQIKSYLSADILPE